MVGQNIQALGHSEKVFIRIKISSTSLRQDLSYIS